METGHRKPDRRVIKTKRAIRNAFAKALSEKNIDKITIKDIAEMADINRKTFYNYYDGIYQLVDEIEDEVVTAFDAAIKDLDVAEMVRNPQLLFNGLVETMNKDLEFYGYLLKMDNNVNLAMKLIELIEGKIIESFSAARIFDESNLKIAVDYTVTGMVCVFRNWFNSDRNIPIEEVSAVVSRICVNGVVDIIDGTEA